MLANFKVAVSLLFLATQQAETAATGPAPSETFYVQNGWVVGRYSNSCLLSAQFDNTSIHIYLNTAANEIELDVIGDNFPSIVEGTQYNVNIIFLNNSNSVLSSWNSVPFRGVILESGGRGIHSSLNMQDFSRDFSQFEILGLLYNERLIGSFNLDGSSRAFAALRLCDQSVERTHPTDPFSGRREP